MGSIVTFSDAVPFTPIEEIIAQIEPQQDLHGQDAPYPAGGGVNKADSSKFTQYAPAYGLEFQATPKGFRVQGTVSEGVESIPHSFRTVYINDDTLDLANLHIKAFNLPTGATTRFDTSTKTIVIDYWTFGAGDVIDREINVVIYEGSTEPTEWSPYENICPISGRTEADVTRTGKNLCNVESFPDGTYWGASYQNLSDILNALPVGTYTFSQKGQVKTLPDNGTVQHGRPYITAMVNGSQVPVLSYSVTTDNSPTVGKVYLDTGTFTITEDNKGKINKVYLYCDSSVHSGTGRGLYSIYDIQIELGSTATDYEPYQGETYTIDLNGTRYGGTLDVTNGVLTVTDGYIESYNGETLSGKWISDRDVYAVGTLPTTGAQVVYELANPQTYQLTPQEIRTLLGTNNIWSDTGNVTVTYQSYLSTRLGRFVTIPYNPTSLKQFNETFIIPKYPN